MSPVWYLPSYSIGVSSIKKGEKLDDYDVMLVVILMTCLCFGLFCDIFN